MRPITGTDIIAFYDSRSDLLVLTEDGEFTHLDYSAVASSPYEDNRATAYDYVTTEDGNHVQVLLERATITDGEWFEDALDDDLNLIPSVADEMARIINTDGILPSRIFSARDAEQEWKKAVAEADHKALIRAQRVAVVVAFCGGNQSEAARVLGLDPSTVNKLAKKTKAAYTVRTHHMPQPLISAMSSLSNRGARVAPGTDSVWQDGHGHHLIATKGSLTAHVTLALDHYEDGVDWADGDMTWTVTRDGDTIPCKRWSDVCRAFEQAPPA